MRVRKPFIVCIFRMSLQYCLKMFSCVYCCYKLKDLMKHLFQVHNPELNFKYHCTLSPCSRVFVSGDSYGAFRSHCIRYHHKWRESLSKQAEEESKDNHEMDSENLDGSMSFCGHSSVDSLAEDSPERQEANTNFLKLTSRQQSQ